MAVRSGSPARATGSTSGIWCSTTWPIPPSLAARQQYEALARAMRDILAQRWRRTDATYDRENPKRVYYLSLEFLIGRSLANNVLNLRLDPVARSIVEEARLDWPAVLEEEPDAGLGNGGLGRLAACFLDSMATLQLPAMGYGLRYEYGIFRQTIEDGWQHEQPDNWLRDPDPWEVARPREAVEIKLGSSFVVHEGTLRAVLGRPSHVLGIPYDRPIVGYGGKTINTLRLWACATPDVFDLQAFSAGAFVNALAQRLAAELGDPGPLSRRFDDHGTRPALRAGIFPGRLLARRSRAPLPAAQCRLEHAAGQGRDPAQRHPSQPGRSRADADPARRRRPRMGPGLGYHPAHARLYQPHAAARGAGEMAVAMVRADAAAPSRDHPGYQPASPGRGADAVSQTRASAPGR